MSVQTCVAMTTSGDLTSYEVRTITKNKTADNKAYVSSLTQGKTLRVAGNEDASWEISLYGKSGESEIPDALKAGQEITIQTSIDGSSKTMLIDSSSLEVDIEAGEIIGISLSCSAVALATSY